MTDYPSTPAMKAAVELEIHNALGYVQTVAIGKMIQKVIDATIADCATIAKTMREKHGSPTGDAYSNGVWDQGVRTEQAIVALAQSPQDTKHD